MRVRYSDAFLLFVSPFAWTMRFELKRQSNTITADEKEQLHDCCRLEAVLRLEILKQYVHVCQGALSAPWPQLYGTRDGLCRGRWMLVRSPVCRAYRDLTYDGSFLPNQETHLSLKKARHGRHSEREAALA